MNNRTLLIIILLALGVPWAAWGQKSLPYEYGFENNNLASEGWTKQTCAASTGIQNSAKRTGSYGFRFYYFSSYPQQYLISPELSGATNGVDVTFHYKNYYSFYTESFQVGYSTTTAAIADFVFNEETTSTTTNWTEYFNTLPAGTKYVAIKYAPTSGYYLYLDDFTFEATSNCPKPRDFGYTSLTSSSVAFSWTNGGQESSWQIAYADSPNTSPDDATILDVSEKPFTISEGLAAGTTYYAYIRANCGEEQSVWSPACSFTMKCSAPTSLRTVSETINSAILYWNAGDTETAWQLVYSTNAQFDPNAVPEENIIDVDQKPFVLENLETGTTYHAYVRAVCDAQAGDYSAWSNKTSIRPRCYQPRDLQVSDLTYHSATLSWTAGGNETSWELAYSTDPNFNPDNANNKIPCQTTTCNLPDLETGVTYYAYVRSYCGDNIYGEWSTVCAFTPSYLITVNNGTDNDYYVPFYGYYTNTHLVKSQFIVPASELEQVEDKQLTKLVFYTSSGYSSVEWTGTVFNVYLSATDLTEFSSSTPVSWESLSNSIVYSGALTVSDNQMEITLNTPYTYTGGNLLVAFEETTMGSSNFVQWVGVSTSNYSSYYYAGFNGREKFLPRMTIQYSPDPVPTCEQPADFSASTITLNSATLSWTAGGEETAWQLVYSTSPDFDPDAATPIAVTQPTYTLGIEPDVTYYAYVRAKCDASHYSDWSGPRSFGSVFAAPHDFYPTNVTANTATVTWVNGDDETSWQIVTSTMPDFNPNNASPINVTEKPFTLTNLTTEQTYYAYIRATSGNYHSAWSNVCCFTPTNTQSLTVGQGGALGDVPVPLAYANLGNTKSEFIIPAERLTAMKYGTINRLTFYCDAQTWMGAGIWVYVGETDQTSLNADNLISPNDMTFVHYGKMIVADQQMVVTFNRSTHQYMGGNLVVYFEQYNRGDISTGRWYGVPSDNQAMYYDGTSNQFVGFMPKTTISYFAGSCAEPEYLSTESVTTNSANVVWTAGGSETSWLLQYREANGEWSETVMVNETPSHVLDGLTASTTYEVMVKAACYDDLHSEWTDVYSFTTCGSATITAENPFTENFDGVEEPMPDCWSAVKSIESNVVQIDEDWQYGGGEPTILKYLHFYVYESDNATTAYAVLPEITNISKTQMKFNASGSAFAVGVMENGVFHQVKAFDAMENTTPCVVYFDQYTGNGTNIAIGLNTSDYAELNVDDVEVSLQPSCFVPSSLEVVEAEENALTLQWSAYGDETAWQMQYTNNGTDWTTVDVGQNELVQGQYRLQGLSASTNYQVRLRASCGGNDFSDWTQPITAQTLCGLYTDASYLENFDEIVSEQWQDEEHNLPLCWQWINASTHERNKLFPTVFTVSQYDSQYQSPYSLLKFQVNGDVDNDGEETVYDQYAILPEIADLGSKQIKFSARAGEWGYPVSFVVGVMTDPTDATTFTPVRTMRTSGIEYHDFTVYFEENHSGYIAFKLPAVAETLTVLYIEDIAVTPAPDCKMLFDFALVGNSITDNSATLDWTPNGHETQWQIQYRTDREDWTTVIAGQHPFTLTGLEGNNYYHVRVRARCGEDQYGEWSDMLSFNTNCSAYQAVPYYESFETWTFDELDSFGDMLPCWSKLSTYTDNYTGPGVFTFGGHSGDNYLHFQMDYSSAYQMAILPAIQNVKDMQIRFYAKGEEGSYNVGYFYCDFEVGVMTDPTDASTYQFIQSIHPDEANYTKYTIPFNTYTGNGNYIVFRMVGNPSLRSRAYIDDIVVSEIVNYTNVFTCGNDEGGYWNDPSYWSAGTLPTMDDNVTIKGKAIIPSDYVAEANIVEFGENGSLHVENNGQLKHNNIGVQATFAKAIEGYVDFNNKGNYYLIASPMVGSLDAKTNQYFGTGDVLGLLDGEYDLYRFSQSYDDEWRNYKKDLFTIDMKTGYLYANRDGVTLTYSGTLQPSNNAVEVMLENESTATFDGYNLIGNPFPCDAYLADGRSFYRINQEGTNLIEAEGVIAPCEGIFVQSTAPGQSVAFTRNQPRSQSSMAFTLSKKQTGRGDSSTGSGALASTAIDRARIRFGEGDNLGKLALMASPDRLYIPQNGTDYAVVFSQPVGELPLNFEVAEDGTYTLSFENATEGLVYCHLIDNLTGADVNLLTPAGFPLYKGGQGELNQPRQAEYTFTAKKSDYASRFKVVFASVSEDANGDSETFAFNNNGNWIIANEGRATLQVIDLTGRILSSEQIEGSVQTQINQPAGLYLIRLVNGDNVKVQKVVVR